MNVFINSVVLILFVRASAIEVLRSHDFEVVENEPNWFPDSADVGGSSKHSASKMNSTVFMSVNHYYCAAEDIKDTVLILYGTKSWTFPTQDVNLTLSYPSASWPQNTTDEGYIITGFKVVLYVDSMKTKGYIIGGGVLQEILALSFVSQHISSLSYEFWIYGIPKHASEFHTTRYFKCT